MKKDIWIWQKTPRTSEDLGMGEPREGAKMAPQLKVLFSDPDYLSSVPRSHRPRRRKLIPKICPLTLTCKLSHMYMHEYIYIHTYACT